MDIENFKKERERLHKQAMEFAGKDMKIFHHLDLTVYQTGALDARTKELLGLVASMVLRCDDCITYHLVRCAEEGVSSAELEEAMMVALMVAGSITIPHLRRAVDCWREIISKPEEKKEND
ncbi:carboxymuconolactone decarboxylase family protein [candidate division WOR-3 bacterium]|nr:carboxymuconolactone decarboxylase family protein [candidate division WOR-3 bacterium]